MARIKHIGTVGGREKDFLKLFDQLTYSRSGWQVWEDLMTVMACSICNTVDRRKEAFERREKQYERSIKALGGVDIPAQMLGIITIALEENPNQDFLGKLYMNLNLGSHWHGQFFTPYHVCKLMAKMQIGDGCQAEIESKGYLSVCDPCVGAGAMLIAAAATFRECKVNYQTSALFIGQDIDPVVAKMAYIQLSLLGCPGYITVGNSLTNPQAGHVLFPEENEGQELWIMPLFMHQVWEIRRTAMLMRNLFGGIETTVKTMEKEHLYMFFYFNEKESQMEKKSLNGNECLGTSYKEEDMKSTRQAAREKLERERKAAKDSTFAEPVIGYLLKRCEEEEGFAQDVVQEHKTWEKCFDYTCSQARKQSKGTCTAVRDEVVYEWAEDYYRKDDKAEEETKAKKEAKRKLKTKPAPQKKEDAPKEQPMLKKSSKDMEGQLDMFSMMGM